MKILTLSIKREFFDQILNGTKTHEYREVHPNKSDKYYLLRHRDKLYKSKEIDNIPDDEEGVFYDLRQYDAIKFLTGAYSGKRPWMLVEVKDVALQFAYEHEKDQDTKLTPDKIIWQDAADENIPEELIQLRYVFGEGDDEWYWELQQMDYTLGKVLDKNLNPE